MFISLTSRSSRSVSLAWSVSAAALAVVLAAELAVLAELRDQLSATSSVSRGGDPTGGLVVLWLIGVIALSAGGRGVAAAALAATAALAAFCALLGSVLAVSLLLIAGHLVQAALVAGLLVLAFGVITERR